MILEKTDFLEANLAEMKVRIYKGGEIEKGKEYRVIELFYPLLIESSNDASRALSYFLGRNRTIRLDEKWGQEPFFG